MKNILFSILVLALLQACNIGTTRVYQSDNISLKTKKEIEDINNKLYSAIVKQDRDKLEQLFSKPLLEKIKKSGINPLDICTQLIDSARIANNQLAMFDEFYMKGSSNTTSFIPHSLTSSEDYNIRIKLLSNETFLLLQKVNITHQHTILLTISYGKFNNKWEINYLHGGDYTYNNQTAPELYKKAVKEYEEGNLVNTHINLFLANQLLQPGGEVFEYIIKKEISDFQNKLSLKINDSYQFPIKIGEIESKPEILRIDPQEIENTYAPMIHYLTTINLLDTLKLRIENERIRGIIPQYLKGIDNNKYVCYKAFNKIPYNNDSVRTYGFVHKID